MKHGRSYVPFTRVRTDNSYRYMIHCANCETEFTVGAPRNLPDQVVINKFEQQGLTGNGHAAKDIPREMICASCAGRKEMVDNALFDALPSEGMVVKAKRIRNASTRGAIRFLLPVEFGDFIRARVVRLAVKLVGMHEGCVRFKFRIAKDDEFFRGGSSELQGNATKWFVVRCSATAKRPVVQINESLITQLLGVPLGEELDRDVLLPIYRTTSRSHKEKLGMVVGYETNHLLGEKPETEADAETEPPPNESSVLESYIPESSTPESSTPDNVFVDETNYQELSVEGSMQELRRALETANLHILNLTEKHWQPDIRVSDDGFIRVTVSRTLS